MLAGAQGERYLLASQAPRPRFPPMAVRRGPALRSVHLLQVVQRASEAEGCAVEPAPAQVEGEQEPRAGDQLAAPRRQAAAAQRQHVLKITAPRGSVPQLTVSVCWVCTLLVIARLNRQWLTAKLSALPPDIDIMSDSAQFSCLSATQEEVSPHLESQSC